MLPLSNNLTYSSKHIFPCSSWNERFSSYLSSEITSCSDICTSECNGNTKARQASFALKSSTTASEFRPSMRDVIWSHCVLNTIKQTSLARTSLSQQPLPHIAMKASGQSLHHFFHRFFHNLVPLTLLSPLLLFFIFSDEQKYLARSFILPYLRTVEIIPSKQELCSLAGIKVSNCLFLELH